ncbi:MAG: heparinase, partial [Bacteroidales bacterium]|nr:heparinase [Bacteroidales bacterium]
MLKNKTILTAIAVFASLLFCAGASAQDSPRGFMKKVLDQPGVAESFTPGCLGKKYPAYDDRAGWAKLLGKEKAEEMIATGERYLDYTWQYIPASSYLEFNKSGNRVIMETPYSQNRAALARLLYAELAEGKGRFVPKIADGMYHFAFMPAWIIAAHIVRQPGGSSLPSGDYHFIDLFDGESCSVISWCLYYMEKEVDKIDPFIARATRKALNDNIIDPFLDPTKEPQQWWMGFRGEGVNNWNPWCNFNVMQAFLLVEKDQAKINEAVARSVKSIDIYIDQFNDDGACDEGPGYFNAAAAMLYSWMQEMYDASAGKFNPFDNAKVRRMGEYESRADMG